MAVPTVAWASLSATEIANAAADLPMLVANVIPVSPTSSNWSDQADNSTDDTLSTAPARWAYDGKSHLATTPDATVASTWYYAVDVGADGIEFDCAFLAGHDFDTESATSITLEVADAADFATNLRTIATFSLRGSDKRMADLVLTHLGGAAQRYSDVRYVRLKVTAAGAFTPQLGELILGRRRQLAHNPTTPFDDAPMLDDKTSGKSAGGVVTQHVNNRRRFELSATFVVSVDANIADFRAWFRQVRGAFVWIWSPNSAPNAFHMMMLESQMDMPVQGYIERNLQVEAIEQGPERFFLDVEDNG